MNLQNMTQREIAQQDFLREAYKILPRNRALCSNGAEAWIVDTHDDIDMKLYTKIQRII